MTTTLVTPPIGRIDLTAASDSELFQELMFNGDADMLAYTNPGAAPKYGDRDDSYARLIQKEITRRVVKHALPRAKSSVRYQSDLDAMAGALFVAEELQVIANAEKHAHLFADGTTVSIESYAKKRVLQKDAVGTVDRGKVMNASGMRNAPDARERQIVVADPQGFVLDNAAPVGRDSMYSVNEEIDLAVDTEAAQAALTESAELLTHAQGYLRMVTDEKNALGEDAPFEEKAAATQAVVIAEEAVTSAEDALREAEAVLHDSGTEEEAAIRLFKEKTAPIMQPEHASALLHSTLITRESNEYLDGLADDDRRSRGAFTETETIETLRALIDLEETRLTPERKAVEAADAEEEDARVALDEATEVLDEATKEFNLLIAAEGVDGFEADEAHSDAKDAASAAVKGAKEAVTAAGKAVNTALGVSAKASTAFDREAGALRSLTARLAVVELHAEKEAADALVAELRIAADSAKVAAVDARKRAVAADPRVYRDQTDEEKAAVTAERAADAALARAIEDARRIGVRIDTNATAIERERRYATDATWAISRIAGNFEREGDADRKAKSRGGNVRSLPKEHIGKVMGVDRWKVGDYFNEAKAALYTDFTVMNSLRLSMGGTREANVGVLARIGYLFFQENSDALTIPQVLELVANAPTEEFHALASNYLVPDADNTLELAEGLRAAVIVQFERDLAAQLRAAAAEETAA